MAKVVIDKTMIESLVRNSSDEHIDAVGLRVSQIVSGALVDLSQKVPGVNIENTVLQPANELFTGAMIDASNFVYFLGVDNPQLEINSLNRTRFWKEFKRKIVYAWKNRKKRRSRKKKKEEPLTYATHDLQAYGIQELCEDLQTALAKYCLQTSIITYNFPCVSIMGKEDFGSVCKVVVYPVIASEGNVYKYFVGNKKGFVNLDFGRRKRVIDEKNEFTNGNFTQILKLLNFFYYNANKVLPNQFFMESVLVACPNNLFDDGDIYDMFVRVANYIVMVLPKDIPSIMDEEKTAFNDPVCQYNAPDYNKFLQQFYNLK